MLFAIVKSKATPEGLLRAGFISIGALFLLSPTQFPWYFLWVAPLLPLFPVRGFLAAVVTLPLYYTYFHLDPRGVAYVQTYGIIWLVWLPVWGLLAYDFFNARQCPARERMTWNLSLANLSPDRKLGSLYVSSAGTSS